MNLYLPETITMNSKSLSVPGLLVRGLKSDLKVPTFRYIKLQIL